MENPHYLYDDEILVQLHQDFVELLPKVANLKMDIMYILDMPELSIALKANKENARKELSIKIEKFFDEFDNTFENTEGWEEKIANQLDYVKLI